jgi:hypothetical protein
VPTTCAKKPREFILSVAKDGVVGVCMFGGVIVISAERPCLE